MLFSWGARSDIIWGLIANIMEADANEISDGMKLFHLSVSSVSQMSLSLLAFYLFFPQCSKLNGILSITTPEPLIPQ